MSGSKRKSAWHDDIYLVTWLICLTAVIKRLKYGLPYIDILSHCPSECTRHQLASTRRTLIKCSSDVRRPPIVFHAHPWTTHMGNLRAIYEYLRVPHGYVTDAWRQTPFFLCPSSCKGLIGDSVNAPLFSDSVHGTVPILVLMRV